MYDAAWPGVAGPQAPPKNGTGPRVDVDRAAERIAVLPHRVLAYGGADGFPVVVPVKLDEHDAAGLRLVTASGLLPPGGRRAGLLAHAYRPQLVGLSTRIFTGWLQGYASGKFWIVWPICTLIIAAVAFVAAVLQKLIGAAGTLLTIIVIILFGNPSSGGANGVPYLPAFWRDIGPYLPPRNGYILLLSDRDKLQRRQLRFPYDLTRIGSATPKMHLLLGKVFGPEVGRSWLRAQEVMTLFTASRSAEEHRGLLDLR